MVLRYPMSIILLGKYSSQDLTLALLSMKLICSATDAYAIVMSPIRDQKIRSLTVIVRPSEDGVVRSYTL